MWTTVQTHTSETECSTSSPLLLRMLSVCKLWWMLTLTSGEDHQQMPALWTSSMDVNVTLRLQGMSTIQWGLLVCAQWTHSQRNTVALRLEPNYLGVIGSGQQFGCSQSTTNTVLGLLQVRLTSWSREAMQLPVQSVESISSGQHFTGALIIGIIDTKKPPSSTLIMQTWTPISIPMDYTGTTRSSTLTSIPPTTWCYRCPSIRVSGKEVGSPQVPTIPGLVSQTVLLSTGSSTYWSTLQWVVPTSTSLMGNAESLGATTTHTLWMPSSMPEVPGPRPGRTKHTLWGSIQWRSGLSTLQMRNDMLIYANI